MSDGFTLGGIEFDSWETPEKIPFPAGQKVNKHVLIGGQRQIDAMGPDPEDVTWTGRARGPNASGDMQSIRDMTNAGAAVDLTWGEFALSVIILKFVPEYMNVNEWQYSITVMIVDDATAGGFGGLLSSLDSLIGGDLSMVMSLIQ